MTCPNCQETYLESEAFEDRAGTMFCSVVCCDEYHEFAHAEMLED